MGKCRVKKTKLEVFKMLYKDFNYRQALKTAWSEHTNQKKTKVLDFHYLW